MPKLALAFDILANDAQASRTLDRFGAKAEHTGKRVGHAFSHLKGEIIGALAGIATVEVFKGFVESAEEARKISRLTEQVIKTTGKAAHVTAKQVDELAASISNKTGVDRESIHSSENLLLIFSKIRNEVGKGNDIFTRATQTATDMAVALGTAPRDAALKLGKALNDPIKGLTALSRAGVQFTDQQKKQIKAMVESGNILGAQRLILDSLAKKFGGAAEAAATPTEKLHAAMHEIGVEIGTLLLPAVDKVATFLNTTGVPAIEHFVTGFQNGTGAGGKFATAVHEAGDGLDHAWHVGKPFLSFIAAHPKLFTDVAVGAGALAAAFKIMGSVKKLPGLGSLVSKATPLPVFVTNPGFGIGGPKGGPKVPPVVTAGKGGKVVGALKAIAPVLVPRVLGPIALTAGDSGPQSNAQKQNREFVKTLADLTDTKSQYTKAYQDLLKKASGMTFDTSDSKNHNRVAVPNLVAEYDFLVKYGKKTSEVRAKIAALAKDPTVAAALRPRAKDVENNTRLISGDLLGVMNAANQKATKIGDDVDKGLGGGLGRAKEKADALRDSLDQTKAPKINPATFVGLGGGMARAKENADNLRESINGLPSAFKPPVDAAHSFLTQLGKIPPRKDIIFTASIQTSGKRVKIAGLTSDSAGLYVQGRGGKLVLADGGWVRGPGTSRSDSIPAMLSNREFVMNAKAAQKYGPQLEAMNAGRDPVSGKGSFSIGDVTITVADNKTALSVPNQLRDMAFLAGY